MEKKKRTILRVITGILTIGIMMLIFSFSAQNGEASSGTSGKIVEWMIQKIFQPIFANNENVIGWLEENLSFIVRKLAHFSIYTALGMSATGFFFTFEELTKKRQAIFAIMLSCLYAATDELHQLFTPGRSGQITDVLLDSVGAIIGTGIIILVWYLVTKRKKQGEKSL